MKSDVTLIKFEGDKVILPLELYLELQQFCRTHGDTLPLPLTKATGGLVSPGTPLVVSGDDFHAVTTTKK